MAIWRLWAPGVSPVTTKPHPCRGNGRKRVMPMLAWAWPGQRWWLGNPEVLVIASYPTPNEAQDEAISTSTPSLAVGMICRTRPENERIKKDRKGIRSFVRQLKI